MILSNNLLSTIDTRLEEKRVRENVLKRVKIWKTNNTSEHDQRKNLTMNPGSPNSNISEYSSTRLSPSLKIKGRRMPDIILTTAKRRETQYIDPLLRPRWLKNNYQKIDTVKSYENPTGQGINCHRICWPDTDGNEHSTGQLSIVWTQALFTQALFTYTYKPCSRVGTNTVHVQT